MRWVCVLLRGGLGGGAYGTFNWGLRGTYGLSYICIVGVVLILFFSLRTYIIAQSIGSE